MRDPDGHGGPVRRLTTRLTEAAPDPPVLVTTIVLGGFLVLTACYVVASRPEPLVLAGALTAVPLVFCLQFLHCLPRPALCPARRRYWTLGLQGLLTYLPYPVFGDAWLAMPGLLAGSALAVLPPRCAWPAFAGAVLSAGPMALGEGWGTDRLGWVSGTAALMGLVVYGLSRMARLVHDVRGSRREFAQAAVDRERQRFARDLHDLLGCSLTTIAYKSELARRSLPPMSSRARRELTEIMETARQALSDVRAVSYRYRDLSLRSELSAAESTLAAAGVRVVLRACHGPLPHPVETTLATVLREGVTNMLRHSGVRTCVIETGRDGRSVRLCVVNDGVPGPARARFGAAGAGSGLGNLRTRVEALDGRLAAEVSAGGGWFRLTAVVPVSAAAPGARSGDGTGVPGSATVA
ncbi:histidine kinase [Streptomyces sp. NPDC037389]|uniref:sensor histidine kinase n=1 Tax=Streptomyces sp. NPDC037389 TaxID=3155369 RepID=UPI0033DF10E4